MPVAAVQNRLSLAERGSEPVLAACERDGIPFVAWAPLAKGFSAAAGGRPAAIARRHGATPAQVALAWLLARSPVTVPIPGTASVEHLEENLGAPGLELTADELTALGSIATSATRRGGSSGGRASAWGGISSAARARETAGPGKHRRAMR